MSTQPRSRVHRLGHEHQPIAMPSYPPAPITSSCRSPTPLAATLRTAMCPNLTRHSAKLPGGQSVRDHRQTVADVEQASERHGKSRPYVFTPVVTGPILYVTLSTWPGGNRANRPGSEVFLMYTKRRAARILAATFIGAAVSFLTALGPGSNLAVGNSPATNLVVASSTNSLVSLFTYFDG